MHAVSSRSPKARIFQSTALMMAMGLALSACAINRPVVAPEPSSATASGARPAGTPPASGAAAQSGGTQSGGQAGGATSTPRPDSASLKPFREVVAGAKEIPGFVPIWHKEDKVWLEISAGMLDKPFFFSYNISQGLGERGIDGGTMGRRQLAEFHRVGNAIQLIAKNTRFRAEDKPGARTVEQSFSDSLLASASVLSQPNAERKSVLVDASALLIGDIPSLTSTFESRFRLAYALDRNNSSFTKLRADETLSTLEVRNHFVTARIPGLVSPSNPFPPEPPETTPDPRSFFIGLVYNFAALPAPMHARMADDRVGYFTTNFYDFTTDSSPTARVNFINRWRLEKKDPDAPLSEPKQPIVYWVDKNIPERYRQTVVDGILEWNKAFERIGFKNAIVAKIQPDDADWDNLDAHHASVRWYLSSESAPAVGPSHTDPRTGEILDADIRVPDGFARSARTQFAEGLPRVPQPPTGPTALGDEALCNFAAEATSELNFSLDLLAARGDFAPDSPEADAFAKAYLKSVITHEVGHTLGLRHNFRASTIRTPAQLQDVAYTREHGLSGSIMDYNPFNLAMKGEIQGDYVMNGLGPYDYWAIEYGYKPLSADEEKRALPQIAARNTEPDLAFATDEDASASPYGADPDVNQFDLGADPLYYAKKRFALSHELWDRLQARTLQPGESYLVLRRNFERGFSEIARVAPQVAKFVGGVHITRDHAGTDRALVTPVEADRQKQALKLLATELFSADSFRFKPEFISRLGVDYLGRNEPNAPYGGTFYLPGRLLAIQAGVLDHLLSEPVAARLIDASNESAKPRQLLTLSQVYDSLQGAVWSELKTGTEITGMRRNLQREYLRHMVAVMLRPSTGTLADVKSLQRQNAVELRARIESSLARGSWSRETRAHLIETVATIDDALKARPAKAAA